jgi:signal transduction histidine kinase/ligand-binding sensor domain-containing protein
MISKKYIFLLGLLSLPYAALPQALFRTTEAPALYFNTIGKNQALAGGKVRSIMQDRRGFIYLSTQVGLDRFDGYDISHINFPGQAELSAAMATETGDCLQDKAGNFWIATDYNGLFRYNPAKGECVRFLHDEKSVLYLLDIILDRSGKSLWLATSDGIVRFDLLDKSAHFFFKGLFFLTVFQDSDGKVWGGTTDKGIHSLDPRTEKTASWLPDLKDSRAFPGFYCRAIAQDVNGDMLFGCDKGFFRMNFRSGEKTAYLNDTHSSGAFPSGGTTSFLVDRRGQLWVGTYGSGLVLFDRAKGHFVSYQRKAGMLGSLAGNYIECLFEDDAGQIWVGDHSNGISYFNGNTGFVHPLYFENKKTEISQPGQITCLAPNGNTLYVGMPRGIAAYMPDSGIFSLYPLENTPFAEWKEISSLLTAPDGSLLAGTWHGVLRLNPKTGVYSKFLPDSLQMTSHVMSMMMEGDSALWLSTFDAKLWRVNLRTGVARRFDQEKKLPGRAECNTMLLTKSGRRCFGSYNGFYEFDVKLDSFIGNQVPGYWKEKSNAISAMTEDANGILWIARWGGGLDAFDPASRRYRHFGTEDGLPDLLCRTVQPDSSGRLWVSTDKGMVVFELSKNVLDPSMKVVFKTLNINNGLALGQASCSAALHFEGHKLSGQRLYFGSEDGLTEILPDLLEFNDTPPKPALTTFYLFNRPLVPSSGGILNLPIEEMTTIVLPPKQNFFTLEFSALNLLSPEKNRYRYLLKGYDPNWVDAGVRRSASYTNVPPGSYTFLLEAFNNDGIASQSPLLIKIDVLPAWYQTWWFRTLMLAVLVVTVYGYLRWRLAHLRKMETMRQAIAADLHDEVGASLTSIQILSQLASHPDPARSAEALEKLPEQVRHTSASLREIVWNIQPKHDDINLLLGELTRHAGEVFEKSDIQYTVQADEFPETATLVVALRQHLLRIFKESLNNITKHSRASQTAVFFKMEKKSLVMTVRDDGKGFDPATVPHGNGLDNMKQRAGDVGGNFSLRSKTGEGTEITLQLPLQFKGAWWKFWQK